ncbi:MAG: excinuclease ABC subunit C, partial [Clostridia bacterium]|nr:excinuclease ABC subunit C [Clostridia bacterium]
MNDVLEKKIKMLPDAPGVYVMLNGEGQVIYVGKAKVLKNRVRQYFHQGVKTDKVMAMVSNIADFYYVITRSEVDALSLENNLIKKHKPKYNILLKDDKTYPYLKIDLKKAYPYFEITRRITRDGAKYFGPFMGGVSVKDILEIINECYMLRSCTLSLEGRCEKRECLNYHIKRCFAPCTGKISPQEYALQVNRAIDFLSGNDEDAERILTEKMARFADNGEFELAISVRERLKMLDKVKQKKITNLNRFINADIIAVATNGLYYSVNLLITRNGRMQGAKSFSLSGVSSSISDATAQFIRRYYSGEKELPDEIILYSDCEEADLLSDYFKTEYKKSVSILVPKQGVRRQLAKMAFSNAEDYLDKTVSKILHDEDMTVNACQRLKEVLKLSRYPRRMEC